MASKNCMLDILLFVFKNPKNVPLIIGDIKIAILSVYCLHESKCELARYGLFMPGVSHHHKDDVGCTGTHIANFASAVFLLFSFLENGLKKFYAGYSTFRF
jgi:hypothetical protein